MTSAVQPRTIEKAPESGIQSEAGNIGAGMQIGIGAFGAWAIGVSANIGSMAFLFHGSMIAQSGPLAAVVAWILAAFMALPLALVLAELSSMFPSAGGPYVYKYVALKRMIPGMGELLGFLTGWIFWIYLITGYACMACGLCNLLSNAIWGAPQASPIWFGPLVISTLFGVVTVLNLMQVRSASLLNGFFTILKLATALAFIALVFCTKGSSWQFVLSPTNLQGGTNFTTNVLCVLPFALAGFSGIEMAGCTSSETANARRSVPWAIIFTVATVACVYIGMCVATAAITPYALSADKAMAVVPGTSIIATAPSLAAFLGGAGWGQLLTLGVVMSIASCGFCGLLAAARTSLSMAQTGLFPKQFAQLNEKTKVPQYALIFQLAFLCATAIGAHLLSRVGIFPDAYSFLGGTCGYIYGVLAMLYGVCLLGLRYTDPDLPRPFRLGKSGNTVAWLICVGAIAVFGFVAFGCSQPAHQWAGIFFLLCGLPIYGFYRWRR